MHLQVLWLHLKMSARGHLGRSAAPLFILRLPSKFPKLMLGS